MLDLLYASGAVLCVPLAACQRQYFCRASTAQREGSRGGWLCQQSWRKRLLCQHVAYPPPPKNQARQRVCNPFTLRTPRTSVLIPRTCKLILTHRTVNSHTVPPPRPSPSAALHSLLSPYRPGTFFRFPQTEASPER
ncbi:hypothetical protein AAFF_G00279080 [Aldrovandia affinis]|uniref:Secreted protein n=1 Tax=Aldrovandia affinis TaxID=143900 RepID=A0AAD7SR20_9TELE|nr:hypothetical protein AAFF_G00279080 [Aldrovandia affinis]